MAKIILSGMATLMLIPVAIYVARYRWDRRRWHAYEALIRAWAREEFLLEDMTDEDWKALTATKLSEAGFEPAKVKEFIELGVWVARGRASQETRGRISLGREREGDADREQPK